MAGSSSKQPQQKWDPNWRTNYDIWPNLVDYYERHQTTGCDLPYLMPPLRLKIERYLEAEEAGQVTNFMKPVQQPKYTGKARQKKLREMREQWMIHAGQPYKEADLKLNLEPPKLIVAQYRDFQLQGRDMDFVDPVLRHYCEEQLALRDPYENMYEGFPAMDALNITPHGNRFGNHGVRSKALRMTVKNEGWPEGWSGGRPLPIPSWMTGDVSSWEKQTGGVGRAESIRKKLAGMLGLGKKGKGKAGEHGCGEGERGGEEHGKEEHGDDKHGEEGRAEV